VLLIVAAARTKRAWQEANYPKAAGEPQDATHPATQQPAPDRPADRL
jgi:hypothetical protein